MDYEKAFISFYIIMCHYLFTFTDDYSFLDRVPDQWELVKRYFERYIKHSCQQQYSADDMSDFCKLLRYEVSLNIFADFSLLSVSGVSLQPESGYIRDDVSSFVT
ncbi:hypothetical protein [Salmonella enterica]|uniref:hypothetical protein n=1 Tax=Salmonella enterica TaxID=28901 RepID=UPI000DEC0914|nr:hypothetical protein [Salmonella enterica]AXD11288.1 hypothetical protein CHE29_21730 [Salmonella enterica]